MRTSRDKDQYFTTATIQAKAVQMREKIDHLRQRHPHKLLRDKAALLILDMQSYFLAPESHAYVPGAPVILPGIGLMKQAFSNQARPVVFTRHLNTLHQAGNMGIWWRQLITAENPLSQISPELDTSKAVVVNKTQYDAFYKTDLEGHLRALQVTQVVVSGVLTHLCCETTARSAFMRGFDVFFAIDGTATFTEELHTASLLTLSHGFAVGMLVSEILEAFQQSYAS